MKAFRPQTLAFSREDPPNHRCRAVEKGYDLAVSSFTRDYTVSDAVILPDLIVRAGLLE